MAEKTIYVIGAGASSEVNIPTGEELKLIISDLLNIKYNYGQQTSGDYSINKALRNHTNANASVDDLNEHLHECWHISENMPLAISIDNFIDTERGNEKIALCGKLAIVRSILEAEKNSLLFIDQDNGEREIDYNSIANTWYLPFFKTITENCSPDELPARFSRITLVIFNYDRCIEHFLINSLIRYYRLSIEDAKSILDNITMIHPYGMIGSLGWQSINDYQPIHFGGNINSEQLLEHAFGIRTFTEGAASEIMATLHDHFSQSERIIFLGYAFHRLNMQLLSNPEDVKYKTRTAIRCYATAYKTSKSDQDSISDSILSLFSNVADVAVSSTSCEQFYSDYSRSLGFNG